MESRTITIKVYGAGIKTDPDPISHNFKPMADRIAERYGAPAAHIWSLHNRRLATKPEVAEFVKDVTGTLPLYIRIRHRFDYGKPLISLLFANADEAKTCGDKLNLLQRAKIVPTIPIDEEKDDGLWRTDTRWIRMEGLGSSFTSIAKQQIIDHIAEHGECSIESKDIYLQLECVYLDKREYYLWVADIECANHQQALQVTDRLSLTELNDNKIWVQMTCIWKRNTRYIELRNLKTKVTEKEVNDHIRSIVDTKEEDPIQGIRFDRDKERVIARVCLETVEDADETVEKVNCSTLSDRKITATWITEEDFYALSRYQHSTSTDTYPLKGRKIGKVRAIKMKKETMQSLKKKKVILKTGEESNGKLDSRTREIKTCGWKSYNFTAQASRARSGIKAQ